MKKNYDNKVKAFLVNNDMEKYFSPIIVRRLITIEDMLHMNRMSYCFDALYDASTDEYPTAVFEIKDSFDEDNKITAYISDLKSICFYGATCCVDKVGFGKVVGKLVSSGIDGIGFDYFSPVIDEYDGDIGSISLTYTLPVTTREYSTEMQDILGRLVLELLIENGRFLEETEEYNTAANMEEDFFYKENDGMKDNTMTEEVTAAKETA